MDFTRDRARIKLSVRGCKAYGRFDSTEIEVLHTQNARCFEMLRMHQYASSRRPAL